MIIEKATDDSVKSVNIVFGDEEFLMFSLVPSVFIKDTFTTTSVLVIKGITKVKFPGRALYICLLTEQVLNG